MIKLSACTEMVFSEIDGFPQRIQAAAQAGLRAVEFWGCSNKDIDAIVAAKEKAGVQIAAVSVEPPRGMLDAALADEYARSVETALHAARRLGTKVLIAGRVSVLGPGATSGEPRPRLRSEQHAGIVACLQAAAPVAEAAGVTLALEPLNSLVDYPGYYLTTSAEGFEIVEEVGSPNVRLLYDIYHQQVTEGNLIATITANIDKIAHFHAADVPGRHEPGTGEINWANVLAAIDQAGYEGYVGLEYRPTTSTAKSLEHIMAVVNEL